MQRVLEKMKNYQLCLKTIITILCIGFFAPSTSFATHIVGGEMTYRCLGNNRYEIILTVYRDCYFGDPNAGFDDPAYVGFFRADNLPATNVGTNGYVKVPYDHTDTLDGEITSECKVLGQDVCVHRAVYRTIVVLPYIAGGYTATYQRCCRNQSILNIEEPLNTGAIFSVKITQDALTSCNNSPMIDSWPPVYICANKPIDYDHSAIDAEGDSLVYRLCTPLTAGDSLNEKIEPPPHPPYDEVVWTNGYDLTNLLGGSDPLRIDINTGFITGTPPTVGQFLVGICIDEYRNGVLLSQVRRDFQYNVRVCINQTTACFTVPNPICNTFDVKFDNCSEGAVSYKWIFDLYNNPQDTSTEFDPVHTYPGPGVYVVMLIAKEDDKCIDTITQTITLVNSLIKADFTMSVPECSSTGRIITQNLSTGAVSAEWFLTKDNNLIATSNEIQPSFNVNSEGEYCLTLIAKNAIGCFDTIVKCVTIQLLSDIITTNHYNICLGESVQLNPLNPKPNLQYFWSPGTYIPPDQINSPNPTATPEEDITYYVTIVDPVTGCSYRDTVSITLKPEPALDFSITNECGSLLVIFHNNSTNATEFEWNFGDNMTSNEDSPTHQYAQEGTYSVTLSNTDGCVRTITKEIKVNLIDTASINDSIFICEGGQVRLNPNGDQSLTYVWSPANLLDNANSPNPLATVSQYTVFTVLISDPAFSNCTVPGRVAVSLPVFSSDANGGSLICQNGEVPLNFNYIQGPAITNIVWSPDNNILSGQGTDEVIVFAENDQTYYIDITLENGCHFRDTVQVNVSEVGGEVVATIAPDSIYVTESAQLGVIPYDPAFDYHWEGSGLDNPNIHNPKATPTEPGVYTYTVTATNDDGCTAVGSVVLVVRETFCDEDHVFLPNAFSPDGKGKYTTNETLKLYSNYVNKFKLIIYNRFGQEVFTTTNPQFEWDGTFKGKPLDPDVYGYYMEAECVGGAKFNKKGNISLIK